MTQAKLRFEKRKKERNFFKKEPEDCRSPLGSQTNYI